MKTSSVRFASLLPLLLLACDPPPEPGSKVDSLRVLAEQADLPFARPGESVHLTSLSFDPAARPLNWAWARCVNPSDSTLQGCLAQIAQSSDPAAAMFANGVGVSAPDLVIPNDVLAQLPAKARFSATVGVVSVACPGDLSLAEGPGGLPFVCTETGSGRQFDLDEYIVGFKRIFVRAQDRNQNPEIARITFDGQDWPADEVKTVGFCDRTDFEYASCSDAEKHQLTAELTPASFEAGTDEFGTAFDEQLILHYYSTEGIFESELRTGNSPKNGFVARKSASGQNLRLWFVARDDRGGVSWAERQVTVK